MTKQLLLKIFTSWQRLGAELIKQSISLNIVFVGFDPAQPQEKYNLNVSHKCKLI